MMIHVTEDELHAYVDGELPADRRREVEDWLAAHPEDEARIAAWRDQADAIRARYGAVASEPVPMRLAVERITRRNRAWAAAAAAALIAAFCIGGAAGWLARGASAAAPSGFERFAAEAMQAHGLYVVEVRHPVEVPGAERAHLVQWLSKRLDFSVRAPDLEPQGLKLVGGRLLPGPAGPAAFFMYESASGERFTLYCGKLNAPDTAMRYATSDRAAAMSWVDRDFAYVISGPPSREAKDRERLSQVATAAYDRLNAPATPRS